MGSVEVEPTNYEVTTEDPAFNFSISEGTMGNCYHRSSSSGG